MNILIIIKNNNKKQQEKPTPIRTLHHAVLVGVVGVLLGGHLDDGGDGLRVVVDQVADVVGDLGGRERGYERWKQSK